jgi:pimeloyl-ACP methyl ester carboxylesterase
MSRARWLRLLWLGARYGGVVSRRLGSFFAYQLWFTPWQVALSERAQQREAGWLAATQPLRIPFGRRTLSGFTAGQGPTVLLIHGWGDTASRLGAFVAPLVSSGYRVVGVDLPAHGSSPGWRTNAYERSAAILATADHVGGVEAVVAHSMGGVETLIALRKGLAAQRVVLLAPALRLEHAMNKFAALFAMPEEVMSGLRVAIERQFGEQVWDSLASDLLVQGLDVPALLVHDRSDAQVDFADGERLRDAWPGVTFLATDGLGHDRVLRDPQVVAAATRFLDTDYTQPLRRALSTAASTPSA